MSMNEIPEKRRNPRRSEQGSALIIALLVIMALTGLGLVGLKHTIFELRQSNNHRYAKQAEYTSEGALMAGLQRFQSGGRAFDSGWTQFERKRQAEFGQAVAPLPYPLIDSAEFNALPDRFFGSHTDNQSFEAQQNTDAVFTVQVSNIKPARNPPFGFDPSFCFNRYTVTATGTVGEVAGTIADLNMKNPQRGSTSTHVAHVLMGPIQCDQGYRNE